MRNCFREMLNNVTRLNRLMRMINDALYDGYGGQAAVATLMHAYSYGPTTITEMAHHESVSRQYMERVVMKLVAEGKVLLYPNPHRKRSKCVHLTEKGEVAAVMLLHETGRCLEKAFNGWRVETLLNIKEYGMLLDRLCLTLESVDWVNELTDVRLSFMEEARRG